MISKLKLKLENSRTAIRKLSDCIGTAYVASSNEPSDEDISVKSNDVEQQDCQFGSDFKYTTNVSTRR